MAFSGGTFSRTFDCTTDRDNGVKILASKFDTELDGFATGLSTCILKDGTQTCTAAIPFAEGLTIPDDKTIVLGTNSDITIQYDETTNDSLEIAANVEGAALGIVLKADQGDDNADQHKLNIADGGTLTLGSKISGSFVNYLTHTPNSTVASSTTAVAGNLTVGGDLTLGSGAVISEAELEAIDGVTAGTVAASKAVIVDSNKDIASFRNVTLTGELDAGSLDISGDADIDGTLEADAMTLAGTAITATATLDTGISNNNVPKFTSGVADDDFLRVAGTAIEGRSASEVLSDIGGQASLTFGISNTNAVKIDSSSVADDEYARFTANGLESRATSEVLSDIGAAPAAGSSNIVTTGALNSGSITSGFGSIDNGSSAITTTGAITGGSVVVDNITIDGTEIDLSSGDLTIDVAGDIILDADGADIRLKHAGTEWGRFVDSTNNFLILNPVADKDIIFNGIDGSSEISALTLDMSEAGKAIFNAGATFADGCTITTADNTAQLTLTSTDADGSEGPRLDLRRDSGSPADGDILGTTRYTFDNDAAEVTEAVRIEAILQDASDGTEDAKYQIEQMFGGGLFSFQVMSKDGIVFNENSQDIDFRVESDGNANMLFVDAGNDLVGIGGVPDTATLTVYGQVGTTNGTEGAPTHTFYSDPDTGMFRAGGNILGFSTNGSQAAQISADGTFCFGTSTTQVNTSSSESGMSIQKAGILAVARSGGDVAAFNRQTNDGTIIQFHQAGTLEGTISVSGSTVSYNGGHLSRFSQTTDGNRIDGLVKGTVMTNLDQMAKWHHEAQAATLYEDGDEIPEGKKVGDEKTPAVAAYDEDNEQLNCMAVSSVEGDANVAGVFVNWDDDDKDYTADMNVAMTGDMVIRIAKDTTVARGNLLMSAGDGTAKPQGDGYVQDKTIAKVTSTTVSHTYDDGSYLVPCVLMAC